MYLNSLNISHVQLQWIEKEVDTKIFSFSYPMEHKSLQESLQEFGILQPLLIRGKDAHYPHLLLCGHRRLQILREMQQHFQIPILVIPPHMLAVEQGLQLLISENLAHRNFNILEKARILYFALSHLNLSKEEVMHKWMPRLQLKQSKGLLSKFLMILHLPFTCQSYIARQNLPLKTALNLVLVPEDALEILFPLITRLQLGTNKIDEVTQNLFTISKREDKSIAEILEDILILPGVAALITSRKMENAPIAECLRSAIRKRAYPSLSTMEEVFTHESKTLKLPSGISLKPPSHFEGDRLDVQFRFKTPDELKNYAEKLLESVHKPGLKTILDLL